MKAEELMIMDWVCLTDDNTPRQVDWIRSGEVGLFWNKVVTPPYIHPILLTPDILEKNGFTSDNNIATLLHRDDSKYELYKIKYVYYGSWLEMVDKVNDNKLRVHCYYTHELQHALKLCGIEKEIIL